MPKGRGSNSRSPKRGARSKSKSARASTAASRGPLSFKGLPGVRATGEELRRRQQAAEAGGFTREERNRTRQREAEAARLAARKMAKAVNKRDEG